MIKRLKSRYPGPGGMFALSFGLHLVIFLIIIKGQLLPAAHQQEIPVTYVDVVTLPVASPQSGTPAPMAEPQGTPAPPAAAAPPAPAPAPPKHEMALPSPKAKAKAAAPTAKSEKAAPKAPARDDTEFNERMAKLERLAEEKRQADVFSRLKSKAGAGRTGMPGGTGTQAGSDYSSYVQSRFKDALGRVMAKETRSPLVVASITIGSDGKISEFRVIKSSGDQVFDNAVNRAVTLAGRTLKPPPAGQFKYEFHFRPEEVGLR